MTARTRRVLLGEDSKVFARAHELTLRKAGCEVIITQDLLTYEIAGEDDTGRINGRHMGTGIVRPTFLERARYFGLERELAECLDALQQ